MKPKVKFCGMTRSGDIAAAEKLCIDFIGFVFASSSPRSVSLDEAKALRSHVRRAKTVGVFTDHPVDEIEKYAAALQLDFVQLHGEPDIDKVRAISVPVIQAFRGVPDIEVLRAFLAGCPYVLIDKAEGDDQADLSAIAALPADIRSKLFLAGGLTPSNIKTAADAAAPFAVDSARGIESSPGIKDHPLMSAFFRSLS